MRKREKLKIFVISVISFRKVNCDALYRILRHDNSFPTCFNDAFFILSRRGGRRGDQIIPIFLPQCFSDFPSLTQLTTTNLLPRFFQVYCNFDAQSLCQFKQGTGDQFDWLLNKGSTSSAPETGPTADVSSKG